ncbi:hypothetical protein ACH4LT_30550 [Streptomyces clavifer]|uniref:hypothetical protein n=1 Tax=Streptomyces clavifer TaxID=68188 RepID=UPI0037A36CD3
MDEFAAVPGRAVLVAQIEAAGVGLNMQAASVVIICEPQITSRRGRRVDAGRGRRFGHGDARQIAEEEQARLGAVRKESAGHP